MSNHLMMTITIISKKMSNIRKFGRLLKYFLFICVSNKAFSFSILLFFVVVHVELKYVRKIYCSFFLRRRNGLELKVSGKDKLKYIIKNILNINIFNF